MTQATPPAASAEPAAPALPQVLDHLSTDPRSPHYNAAAFEHDVGIRFNGTERFDVAEYCISEGWIKVPAGKTLDRKGQPLMIKLKGRVEAFYRPAAGEAVGAAASASAAATAAAAAGVPPAAAGVAKP